MPSPITTRATLSWRSCGKYGEAYHVLQAAAGLHHQRAVRRRQKSVLQVYTHYVFAVLEATCKISLATVSFMVNFLLADDACDTKMIVS